MAGAANWFTPNPKQPRRPVLTRACIALTPPVMDHGPAPLLQFVSVTKKFAKVAAIDTINLTIRAGSFVALVGASGSGKSTLLKTVNRLGDPDLGQVLFKGRDVRYGAQSALRRRIGYVFQSVGLFPHMNVAENIGIGPRLAGNPASKERIAQLLQLVELGPQYAQRMPHELSGGQRQRIGVARALAGEPQLLLMDEPFGALDPITRDGLGKRVRALHDQLGLTSIMVTHDMAEALLLADRVLVMDGGRIAADETPHALLTGKGGKIAQALVAVPREQALALADMGLTNQGPNNAG